MPRIFISHSSKDKEFVRRLVDDLQALGHSPWLDEWEIRVGECIPTKIQDGLREAAFVVVILSPDAVASGWVEREWKARYFEEVERRSVIILPLLHRKCEVPLLLRSRKYADFSDKYEIGLAQLSAALVPRPIEQTLQSPVALVSSSTSALAREVEDLLAKVHRPDGSVAEAIAAALSIARRAEATTLEEFCRLELTGYKDRALKPADPLFPRHRIVEVFCSISATINPVFIGFGGSASAALNYIEQDKDNFVKVQYMWTHSVKTMETTNRGRDPASHLLTWSGQYGELRITDTLRPGPSMSSGPPPDRLVYFYARPDTNERVLGSVRQVLIGRLLELLPVATMKPKEPSEPTTP